VAAAAPLPRYLRERFLDGLVVSSTSEKRNEALDKDFTRFSIPAVFLNAAREYNSVSVDDRGGIIKATRHLIDLGHRNILYVGTDSPHYSNAERESGYRETLEAAGLPAPVYFIEEGTNDDRWEYERRTAANQVARRLFLEKIYLKQRPTGIVCYDDRVAMAVMKALAEARFDVPGDVSIVGFNDMPFMDMLPVSLTTVHADFHAMGCLAGELLLDLIHTGAARVPSPIVKPELVVRQSSAPPT